MPRTKLGMDYLFYCGRYAEACDLCQGWLDEKEEGEREDGQKERSRGGIRRDMYEAVLVCAVRAERWPLARRAARYLEGLHVEDAGLAFVLEKYTSRIPVEQNDPAL